VHIVVFSHRQALHTIEFSTENGQVMERHIPGVAVIPDAVLNEIRRKFEMGVYEGEMSGY
jgi:hypothetical protein